MRWIAVALLLLAPLQVAAYSRKQENVLNHLADAIAVTRLCSSLKLNETLAAASLVMFKIDDGVVEIERRVRANLVEMGTVDEDIACASGTFLYGPNGINVAGLLIAGVPDTQPQPAKTEEDDDSDIYTEAGRFAQFYGMLTAIEEKCPGLRPSPSAVAMDTFSTEDQEIITNLMPGAIDASRETIAPISCLAATGKALKLTDLDRSQVWETR